jgi:chemotaxis protein MotA
VDFSTVIGLLLGAVLVVSAIVLGQNSVMFLDWPALLIVVGGTLGVTFIKNPLERVFGTLSVVRKAFFTRIPDHNEVITLLVELAEKARRESLLALHQVQIGDPFLARGVRLAVDGMEPAAIRRVMDTEINALAQRHKMGQELLEGVAFSAPAFGMIGTLIGLAQMLSTIDDPARVGPGMAVALMTTLYGALIANLFALPLAEKLKNRSREEVTVRMIMMQGVLSITEGDHPTAVQQKLTAFLAPRLRKELRAAA